MPDKKLKKSPTKKVKKSPNTRKGKRIRKVKPFLKTKKVLHALEKNLTKSIKSKNVDQLAESLEKISENITDLKTEKFTIDQTCETLQVVDVAKDIADTIPQEFINTVSNTVKNIKSVSHEIIFNKFNVEPHLMKVFDTYGINVSDVKEFANSYGSKAKNLFDSGKTIEEATKIIVSDMEPIIKDKVGKLKTLYTFTRKVLIGLVVLMIVFMLNSILIGMLMFSLGETTGIMVGTIMFAPIIEETSKCFFVNEKMGWLGTTIVYGAEFMLYAVDLITAGGSIPMIMLVRSAGLLLHYTTTYIQTYVRKYNSPEMTLNGWIVAVMVHSMYNLLAILNGEFLGKLIFGFDANNIDKYFLLYKNNFDL